MARPVHFEIQANDVQRAIKFYSEIFGWQFTEYMPDVYWLIITGEEGTPGINGGLGKRGGPQPPKQSGTNAFVCTLEVDNVDEVIDAVLKAGGEEAMAKHAVPGQGWLFYFLDTEGNTVGAMQRDPNAA